MAGARRSLAGVGVAGGAGGDEGDEEELEVVKDFGEEKMKKGNEM